MKIKSLDRIEDVVKFYSSWKRCVGYKPRSVVCFVSSKCNCRCIMCNIWKLVGERSELVNNELSTQEWTTLLEELSEMGTEKICLSGGEPLLREDILDIVRYAKKDMHFNHVEITTNGTLVTEAIAEELVTSGLDMIDFSIDSHIAEIHEKYRGIQGAWQRAIRGVQYINRAKKKFDSNKPSIGIGCLVSKLNYQHIDKMVDLKSELGYDVLHFHPIIANVPGIEALFLTDDDLNNLETRLDFLRTKFRNAGLPTSPLSFLFRMCRDKECAKRGRYNELFNKKVLCFSPWEETVVDPFGNVYPCCRSCSFQNLSEDLEHSYWGTDKWCMGNIRNTSFSQIWNNDNYHKFREILKEFPPFHFCGLCGRSDGSPVLTGLFKDRSLLVKIILSKIRQRFKKTESFEWEDYLFHNLQ